MTTVAGRLFPAGVLRGVCGAIRGGHPELMAVARGREVFFASDQRCPEEYRLGTVLGRQSAGGLLRHRCRV